MHTSIIYREEEEEKVALWEGYRIASVKASAKMNSLPTPLSDGGVISLTSILLLMYLRRGGPTVSA